MNAPVQLAEEAIQAALPDGRSFAARPTDAELAALPNAAAVYLLHDAAGRPVQLATTQQLRRLTIARLGATADEEPSRRADLAEITRGIRWREVHSRFEADLWYYRLARRLFPHDYLQRVSFRSASFLHVDSAARIPELRLDTHVYQRAGEFLGPFPTRTQAQAALEGLWDLFDLCRYPEQIRKLPHGQRCAYADMGRCDAPCDGSVPLAAYAARTAAAWRFALGGIAEWRCAAEQRMHAHAENLQFERAAVLKTQLEFARRWERDWVPRVWSAAEWRMLLVIPVARRRAWKLFYFDRGRIESGAIIRSRAFAAELLAAAASIRTSVTDVAAADPTIGMEQAWLLAHFLHHKQSEAALMTFVPEAEPTAAVAERLTAVYQHRAAQADPPAAEQPDG